MTKEQLAEKLHEWYLEATKELEPYSINKQAQKPYTDLSEGQKSIDRYIAEKIILLISDLQNESRYLRMKCMVYEAKMQNKGQ